ncbi:MAG TPA: Zn-ribbon domain-containing OB-fold protein [Streptosporangiaceae bacterium]|nr:Zn-ribbon domain-containing OB-fold protein [Streptosporangiaceae bacterium]
MNAGVQPDPPVAAGDADTSGWWDATREHRFVVQACGACGAVQHYPRAICTSCGSPERSWLPTAGEGTVETYTVVHRSPGPAFDPPYVVALVRLPEGPVLLTNVVGCAPEDVHIGLGVQVSWRPLADGRNLPVFEPKGDRHGLPADR